MHLDGPTMIYQRRHTFDDALNDVILSMEPTVIHESPDCRSGKHGSCTGDAWDLERDQLTACPCGCHKAPPP